MGPEQECPLFANRMLRAPTNCVSYVFVPFVYVGTINVWPREFLGPVRDTNWGAVFDVVSRLDANGVSTSDLAYSNQPLALHVDNPYRHPPPGYQLLHCLQVRAEGSSGRLLGAHCDSIERNQKQV